MSALSVKGGIPVHVNGTTAITTTEKWRWTSQQVVNGGGPSNFLWFKNTGGGSLVLSFTKDDADAGRGITLAASEIWEGPAELDAFYTSGAAAARTFEAVAFIRRG